MSITKAKLVELGQRRESRVEVEPFGTIILKSVEHLQDAIRQAALYDGAGNYLPAEYGKLSVWRIIDQVYDENGDKMFSDDDFDWLSELNSELLGPLQEELARFNLEGQKKVSTGEPD